MMRELDTGSAYRVQFKTSADHHTLGDLDELVQNHEQELKAHGAAVQQAAERQNQLNAQLQMLYDTRTITRVTGLSMADLQHQHDAEQHAHDEEIKRAAQHKEALNIYGGHLQTAVESEAEHEKARMAHQVAEELAKKHKATADAAAAQHKQNLEKLNMNKPEFQFRTPRPAENPQTGPFQFQGHGNQSNTYPPNNKIQRASGPGPGVARVLLTGLGRGAHKP